MGCCQIQDNMRTLGYMQKDDTGSKDDRNRRDGQNTLDTDGNI